MPRHSDMQDETQAKWIVEHFGRLGGNTPLSVDNFDQWFATIPMSSLPCHTQTPTNRSHFK